ncbi:RNA polymerase 2 transcription elongation factor [Niveomyces insectorum RCEF 264]|uniref:RNA polymerase 2 transcription elongation factor n=1 Tax=Niveomyces insectorum RCEF 264 TaxID=1081102 RepID=A0A167YR97_9HYPO|nr:RNA polymerase 2 transcription elongation factor [Niveomyces insectorum RCEF 264]
MSDVDDELLALAGGDMSSDEEESSQPQQQQRKSKSSAGASENEHEDDDEAPVNTSRGGSESRPVSRGDSAANRAAHSPAASASRGSAVNRTPAKKARRRTRSDDESEEEGEASPQPSTPSSLQSAPMEESDSDSEADVVPTKKARGAAAAAAALDDDDDDENKYPVDGLFASHEEKEEIMSMREVDREQILAERAQEKDRIHQNKLLRQLVSNDEQRKKRTASAADLDDGQRKTSRVRTKVGGTKVGETKSAIDTLKSRRAEKNERTRRREEDRERRKDRPSSSGDRDESDEGGLDDADAESDVEWAKPSRRSHTPNGQLRQTAELRDVERVRLSRSRFGQVCFYPGFEEAITGTFVRISIGPDPETREPVYRMAAVKGFANGKPYAITGPQGQMIVTDQYVVAAHGKAQKEWPFLACSDSAFTEAEWSRYQKVCRADNVAIPKKGVLLNKADDINKLIGRQWTEQELVEKVKRQQELKGRFSGVDRMRLEYAIKEAKALGNLDRASQLQDELDNLETPRLAFKTSLTPAAKLSSSSGGGGGGGGGASQQERLALLNAENRRRNAEAVRKAQLRERKKTREIERRIELGEEVEDDHSRRVKTRAKFLHDANGSATPEKKPTGSQPGSQAGSQVGSRASTPAAGATPRLGAQKGGNGLLPHLTKLQQKATAKNGLPLLHKPLEDDDIIASLDLDIDENILD